MRSVSQPMIIMIFTTSLDYAHIKPPKQSNNMTFSKIRYLVSEITRNGLKFGLKHYLGFVARIDV